jgi:hypothetical protein
MPHPPFGRYRMKPYYECHITMEGDRDFIEKAVENVVWTFSCIDGDPDLGPGVKCYATRQYNCLRYELQDVIDWMESTAETLSQFGCKVLRKKVEKVLYDVRVA